MENCNETLSALFRVFDEKKATRDTKNNDRPSHEKVTSCTTNLSIMVGCLYYSTFASACHSYQSRGKGKRGGHELGSGY